MGEDSFLSVYGAVIANFLTNRREGTKIWQKPSMQIV